MNKNDTNKCITAIILSGGEWDSWFNQNKRVYSINGIAPTITTCGGGHTEPKILSIERKEENKDERI